MSETFVSTSSLKIEWLRPSLDEEEWEFFHHPAKQPFYRRHSLDWEDLCTAFSAGILVPWPRAATLDKIPVSLAYHSYDDYLRYLAKARRNYRLNYNKMETALQRDGGLKLPAPIVVVCGDEGLLFSGYRRLMLAWNYGMVPAVWRVDVEGGSVEASGLPQRLVEDDSGGGR